MKFETKYNIEDIVWFMKNDRAVSAKISSVTVFKGKINNKGSTIYTAEKIDYPTSWLDFGNLYENMLFSTKEDLLASL